MKINKILAAFMLCAAVFTACNTKNPPVVGPGGDDDKKDTTVVVPDTTAPDTIGWNIPAEVLTVAQARDIASNLESGATSNAKYYIMGWVKKLHSKHADGITNYGNAQFYIEDVKGANSSDDFLAYQVYGPNGEKLTSADQVVVGDFVVLYGEITNYNGTYETVGKGAAYIWKSTNALINGGVTPTEVTGDGSEENPYTASDIIALNNTVSGLYFVKGYIVGQVPGKAISAAEFAAPFTPSSDSTTYGTNIIIAASATETTSTNCVPVQLPTGAVRTALNLPENPDNLGKEVLLYGSLEKYFGQAGIKSISYVKIEDTEIGTKPTPVTGDEMLSETLLTQASFDKFTAVNVKGDQAWTYSSKYGATMSGYNNTSKATEENEDWFISPAMDLTGKSSATLTFNHAFGPDKSVPSTDETKAQYTVWVSNDYNDDVTTATWTQLEGMTYGTTGWGYVSSGNLAIPAANLKANCRIAWKYTCTTVSATWEIKEVIVK